jgi:hypothetical protein
MLPYRITIERQTLLIEELLYFEYYWLFRSDKDEGLVWTNKQSHNTTISFNSSLKDEDPKTLGWYNIYGFS